MGHKKIFFIKKGLGIAKSKETMSLGTWALTKTRSNHRYDLILVRK